MKRVGIWFTPSKWKKFRLEEFIFRCRDDFEMVQIDMTRDIESQGPFHVILHKVVDLIKSAEKGDTHAQECIDRYERFIKSHPEILVFDNLDACRKILDRGEQCRLARQCEMEVDEDAKFFAPNFIDIQHTCSLTELKEKLTSGGIRYPFITKCPDAQAADHCHQMALIFSEEGLRDVQMPCIIQNFVSHSATLFKMFCLGEHLYVVGRKSIKNFSENGNNRTTFFDSRDISKQNSKSVLTEVAAGDRQKNILPDMARFAKLAKVFRSVTQLELLGVDFCVEDGTGRYAAVDINVFPGYDGVPDLHKLLREFLLEKIKEQAKLS